MNIRTATLADLDRIAELEAICFPPSEAAARDSFRERLTCYPGHFWLLEDGDRLVSFINGMVTDQEHLTDEMYENAHMHREEGAWQMLFGVDTAPEYRCHGYAGALIEHVIRVSGEQKRKGLVLTCKEHLVHYYAKFGFRDEGISASEHGGAVWHEMRLTFSDTEQEIKKMDHLKEIINGITPVDREAMDRTWKCWDSLCKPLRGLGILEEMLVQIAGIYGTEHPHPDKRAVLIMGADNGVVKEGVTQTDSSVTVQVLENMGDHLSTACVMCSLAGCDLIPVNIGCLTDGKHPAILNRAVRHGTGNIAEGPAMTREECIRAILTGADIVRELKEAGYQLIVTGEMGIGNTTTSAACAAVLFDQSVETVTGRGAGLSTEGLGRKINAVKKAILVNRPDKTDAIDVISKVGGLDIAGMTGCYLGAAYYHLPILIDGFISAVSAYLAGMLCETSKEYMIPTHCTTEPASQLVMDRLGMKAPLQAGMHLGEGTGAIMGLSLLDQALNVYYHLTTWDGGHVEAYTHQV